MTHLWKRAAPISRNARDALAMEKARSDIKQGNSQGYVLSKSNYCLCTLKVHCNRDLLMLTKSDKFEHTFIDLDVLSSHVLTHDHGPKCESPDISAKQS